MSAAQIDNDVYGRLADAWWDENGIWHGLKLMLNPWRVPYFERALKGLNMYPAGKRALDVGCGGGLLAEDLAALGFAVTGIDPSEQSIEAAQFHARQNNLSIDYRVGYGDQLSFDNGSFDVVFCCDVLEHIQNWAGVIAEIARVLKPGGVFCYDTINRTSQSNFMMIKMGQEWLGLSPPNTHVWDMFITPDELDASLTRHGLQRKGLIGGAPKQDLRSLITLIGMKIGTVSRAEFGRRSIFQETNNLSVSYAGYAIKP